MLARIGRAAAELAAARPRVFTMLAATASGGAGDVVAQSVECAAAASAAPSPPARVDASRAAACAGYYAAAAYAFWHPFFDGLDRRFGCSSSSLRALAAKVALTNFVAIPLLDIPGFYVCAIAPRIGLEEALHRLRTDYRQAVFAAWVVWLPATTITCWYLPAHFRLPAMYFVDVLWACTLSLKGNASGGGWLLFGASAAGRDGAGRCPPAPPPG